LTPSRSWFGLALLVIVAGIIIGCGREPGGLVVANQRPEVTLSLAPLPGTSTAYPVQIRWSAFDVDGRVVRFHYAVDAPASGDTTWTSSTAHELTLFFPATTPEDPLPPPGESVIARDYHTFVIKAVDNEGAYSAVVARSFTSRTVAPYSQIVQPLPNRFFPVSTRTSVLITWEGQDPDARNATGPIEYRYKIVPAVHIQPGDPEGVTPAQVQDFFGRDAANRFADWNATPPDSTFASFEGLTPGTPYYFAVVAFDEAGAFEPRFSLNSNVLEFRPTLVGLGPRITISNGYFHFQQNTGGISLDPRRWAHLEVPAGVPVHFQWSASAYQGAVVAGFRWSLDIEGQDIRNEERRENDADVHHWSTWSLNETSATVGPFGGATDSVAEHYFYLEARDNVGFVSLLIVRLVPVAATFERPLLVVDDMYGALGTLAGSYPTEAEQDSFHFAVGGVPDRLTGGTSEAGAFAGFPYDTLDYQFSGAEGVPLSTLGRYRAVAWYLDRISSGRDGRKFLDTDPSTALRYMNLVTQLNVLAVYLQQGGKLFLFGEGAPQAIANGYMSRFQTGSIAPNATLPYSSGPDPRRNILRPGAFLYDFLHLRSELNIAGTASFQFTLQEQIRGAIPYLPEFQGPATQTDRSHDPRIGPGAERTALRWSGLPRLTMSAYRGSDPDPDRRSVPYTFYISKPLEIAEGAPGARVPVADTLYLLQARSLNLTATGLSDGKPNGIHYYGSEHGEVVWLGFPLYHFERSQARELVTTVLRVLGIEPLPRHVRDGPHAAATDAP
jgi:hypothetical protein